MNKKITCFLLILFLLLTTSYPAVAYENLQHGDVIGGAHRQINQHGIEDFIETAKNDLFMSKYDFEPNAKKLDIKPLNSLVTPYELKSLFLPAGYYTTVPGDWEKDIREDVVYNKTFKQWVIDGGYTADEPERYMSLRHFYTPIGDGASYLTNIPIGGSIMMGDNPGIDAKEWALEHPDNKYSWNNGLKNLKLGFASGLGKDCYGYAAAWRSLGETMHLISDMTTPAHVRNDSHPGNYYASAIVDDLRADPYEYITGHDGSLLAEAFNNPIYNSDLVGVINTSKTPASLFDTVAKYVNLNFFSADTIPYTLGNFVAEFNGNGTSSFQSPDPRNYAMDANEDYIAPDSLGSVTTAASSSSEPLIGYHTSWLSANDWLSADGWVSAETISQRAVLSQARRLIPIAVNSTTKLADLFIPRVKLNYTGINLEKKVIEGEFLVYLRGEDGSYTALDTSVGDMYQKLIIFVDIIEKDNSTKSYAYLAPPVEIVNNKFTISLSDLDEKCKLYTYVKTAGQTVVDKGTDDTEQPQIKISLGIDMGGILVRSGDITADSTLAEYSDYWLGTWETESILIQFVASKEPGVAFEVTRTIWEGKLVTIEKYYVYGKRVDLVDTNVGDSLWIEMFTTPESYEAYKLGDGYYDSFLEFNSYDIDSMDWPIIGNPCGLYKRK